MIRWLARKAGLLHRDEDGASFILVTLALPAIFGMSAFAVDLGYAFYVKSRLQNAADLSALAAGTLLVSGDKEAVRAKAEEYFYLNLPDGWSAPGGIAIAPSIDIDCSTKLETAGVTCYAKAGSTEKINYVKVNARATMPLFFASALGFNTASLSADAVVAGQGTTMPPLNVAIVLDSTGSMDWETTVSCGGATLTKLACAKKGALGMVGTLWPTVDKVALYTYPGVSQGSGTVPDPLAAKANADKNACTSGTPTLTDYIQDTNPAGYRIVDFTDDYRTKTEPPPAGVLQDSALIMALGGSTRSQGYVKDCTGLRTGSPLIYTFYADTIRKAQEDLEAVNAALEDAGKATRQNVIVILSDGDANAPSSYASSSAPGGYLDIIESARVPRQCQEGVNAAREAADTGTWVYSIAYAASTSTRNSCKTDKATATRTITGSRKVCVNRTCTTTAIDRVITLPSDFPPPSSITTTSGQTRDLTNCTRNCDVSVTRSVTVSSALSPRDETLSACEAMRRMASSPDKFYSIDPFGSGGCVSAANPTTTDLLQIFKKVASSLMKKRRVPKTAL